jgi:hypothetical protein
MVDGGDDDDDDDGDDIIPSAIREFYNSRRSPPPPHYQKTSYQKLQHPTQKTKGGVGAGEEVVNNNNAESKYIEKKKLLRDWIKHTHAMARMHTMAYDFYTKVALSIMVPAIILSIGSGATNLVSREECSHSQSTSNSMWDRAHVQPIVLGTLSLISASLTAIYHFMRVGERQSEHFSIASQFEKLARQIRVQMLLTETNERTYVNLSEFIKDAGEQLDNLTDHMPYIPDFIVKSVMASMQQQQQLPLSTESTESTFKVEVV